MTEETSQDTTNDELIKRIEAFREKERLRNKQNYQKRKEQNIKYYAPKTEKHLRDITTLKIYQALTREPKKRGRPQRSNATEQAEQITINDDDNK